MTIIVCIDERRGMLFGGRRQSRDRILTHDVWEISGGELLISPFSKLLFEGYPVRVSEQPLKAAKKGDFVFIEDADIAPFIDKAEKIIIYNWNRRYPADVRLEIVPEEHGFTRKDSCDFVGSSHEKITREVYEK